MYGRLLAPLSIALLLAGCSYIPWLNREEDPRPPTPLAELTPALTVTSLWSREAGKGTAGRRLALAPALSGGRLFVADGRGRVIALSPTDGRTLWERETGLPLSGGPGTDGTRLVIGSTSGEMIALAAADGAELWRAPIDGEVLSVPRIADDLVVIHTLDDSVYGLELATGAERWRYSYPPPVLTLRGSSSPAIVGGSAIVGLSAGRLVNLELASGVPLWEVTVSPPSGRSELERIADIDADPIVVGDTVFVAAYNGDLAAVDVASGSVLWRRTLSAHAGLTAAGGVLFVTDADDQVWAAEPSDGAGIWKQEQLRWRRLSAPAVTGDLVAVGDLDGYVHWLDRRDGRILARTRVGKGPIRAQPLAADGRLYVLGDDGTLAALSPGVAPAATRPSAEAPAPTNP
jgi:outer membrane protein assembly factor BamB